jgi:UDP-N-acetylmuramate--alanine ligase
MAVMKYHFIGIAGVGVGTLASLILDKGHQVSGSDLKESVLSVSLRQRGAQVFIGHAAQNVQQADYVIYSSAIRMDNPELQAARQKNIPILKRAQLLAQIMDNHVGITIAGAHGKTTTTSMISRLMLDAGLNPTTAVGGIINGDSYNAKLGDGKYFVAEVDESDGSFLYFAPQYSIVTNIDFEHLDYYQTWDNIVKAYKQFVAKTQPQGLLIGCGDDTRLKELLLKSGRSYLTYGFSPVNDLHTQSMRFVREPECYWEFDCLFKNKQLPHFQLMIPGQHNIQNAMACIALGLQLGIDAGVIAKSLKSFSGVKRRFQHKGMAGDIKIVDDYGHHPTEIIATIKAAHSVKKTRLITVFQPHRYSRTKFLMDDFVKALSQTDVLILTDIYAASEEAIDGVSSQILLDKIQGNGKSEAVYLEKEALVDYLAKITRPGDLVLTLGAGDIYQVGEDLLQVIEQRTIARTS